MATVRRSGHTEGTLRWSLVVGSMGVVFGEIATSPLYAMRIVFAGRSGITPTPDHVLGILSLVFWSLGLIVGIKYALLVMRADNKGDGGIMALLSLVQRSVHDQTHWRRVVLATGLLGASLFLAMRSLLPPSPSWARLKG